jgi:cyclopropane fatty-acyl-phospholipid synthase-like methyltransferase
MKTKSGGYESGYAACDCFWGAEPSTYVLRLTQKTGLLGFRVLDVGCGEGKNAGYLAKSGADVVGVDISKRALDHAKKLYQGGRVTWLHADVCEQSWPAAYFDAVIAYGLFHCLSASMEIESLWQKLSDATRVGGYHVICTFNDRDQDLSGHPDFLPCLMSHRFYLGLYNGWQIEAESDETIFEMHPHNLIRHHHSLTRILARKPE